MVWSEAAGFHRRVRARVLLRVPLLVLLAAIAPSGCGGADGETRRGAPPRGDGGGSGDVDAATDAGEGGGTDSDDGGRAGSGSAGTGSSAGSGSGTGGDAAGSGEPPPPLVTPSDCAEPAINQPPEEREGAIEHRP